MRISEFDATFSPADASTAPGGLHWAVSQVLIGVDGSASIARGSPARFWG